MYLLLTVYAFSHVLKSLSHLLLKIKHFIKCFKRSLEICKKNSQFFKYPVFRSELCHRAKLTASHEITAPTHVVHNSFALKAMKLDNVSHF